MQSIRQQILTIISLALIAGIVFLCYSPALDGGFVYDDPLLILDDPLVIDPGTPFLQAFTQPYFGAGMGGAGFYRPIMTLLFRYEYGIYEAQPWGFHLDNLLIHLFSCWGLFGLLAVLGACRPWALAAALLLGAHPITTESVAWISGRTDPLAFLFMALSLIALCRYQARPVNPAPDEKGGRLRLLVLALICFLAGLLVKEIAYILFPVVIVLSASRPKEETRTIPAWKTRILIPGAFLCVAVLVFLIQRLLPQGEAADFYCGRGDLLERGLTFLSIVPLYLAKLFWPEDLNIARPVTLVQTAADLRVWYGAAIVLAATAVMVGGMVRKKPAMAVGAAIFLFSLLAVSNTLFPIPYGMQEMDFPFFERYAYLPLVGLLMVFAALAPKRPGGPIAFAPLILALGLCPFLGLFTRARCVDWQSNVNLYLSGVKTWSESPSLCFNLGQAYLEEGDYLEARAAFYKAYHLDSSLDQARIQEAVVVAELADVHGAIEILEEVIARDPENGQAYEALGFVHANARNWLPAFENYSRALPLLGYEPATRASRDLVAIHVKDEMEKTFLEMGDYKAVVEQADRVLTWNAHCTWALEARGLALWELGNEREAQKSLEAALQSAEYAPIRAMAKMVEIYEKQGRIEDAQALYEVLKQLEPDLIEE